MRNFDKLAKENGLPIKKKFAGINYELHDGAIFGKRETAIEFAKIARKTNKKAVAVYKVPNKKIWGVYIRK